MRQPGVDAGEPVHIGMVGGRLGRRGAILRRTLTQALPAGDLAALVFFDARQRAWRAVPTTISADRRTLTARVHHFSIWDDVEYGAGWLLDTRVDPPMCDGSPPSWVDDHGGVVFVDDENAPLRWCVGHDPKNSSLLVVKLIVNRSYGMAVRPSVTPVRIDDSPLGAGPRGLATRLLTRSLSTPGKLGDAFGGEIPAIPGLEVDLWFTEAQVRKTVGSPLVHVARAANEAMAGLTYTEIQKITGDESIVGRRVAAVSALVAIAQCGDDLIRPFTKHQWSSVVKGAIACLTDNAEAIGKDVALTLTTVLPNESPKVLGKIGGKVGGKLWQVWATGAAFQFATWSADQKLIDAAFDLRIFPKIVRKPRPPLPAKRPVTHTLPAPSTPPAMTGLSPGAIFESKCVVAWPSAPIYTSQGIQMTMSCVGVPESKYLFTNVNFDDPNFRITPATGPVDVKGRVVDVARSSYGYSELVVVASAITIG
jgi:hypothetical protein